MVCCNGVIVYVVICVYIYIYIYIMNGWNGCFYLLCCMYTISYHVVHINLNVKSVKREEEVK